MRMGRRAVLLLLLLPIIQVQMLIRREYHGTMRGRVVLQVVWLTKDRLIEMRDRRRFGHRLGRLAHGLRVALATHCKVQLVPHFTAQWHLYERE